MKIFELKPIEENPSIYDELEKRLKKFFKEIIYIPIIKELNLPQKTLKNAKQLSPLKDALFTGKVSFTGGTFSGKFNAGISKDLRALGAKFDRKSGTYKLPLKEVPTEIKQLISASDLKFQQTMQKLDKKLSQIIPEELAEK